MVGCIVGQIPGRRPGKLLRQRQRGAVGLRRNAIAFGRGIHEPALAVRVPIELNDAAAGRAQIQLGQIR